MAFVGNGINDEDILIWDAASGSWQSGAQAGGGTGLQEVETFDLAIAQDLNNHPGGSDGTPSATGVLIGANVTISSLTCYCDNTAAGDLEMGVYEGSTGNLLASTGIQTVVLGANTHPVTPAILTGGGLYYFALWNNSNQPQFLGFSSANQGFQRLRTPGTTLALPANLSSYTNQINNAYWLLGIV